MRTLTPQRRRATILAACAAILAPAPTVLFSHTTGRGRDFFTGMCLGVSIVLLISALALLVRSRSACTD